MHNKIYIVIGSLWIIGIVLIVNSLRSAQSIISQQSANRDRTKIIKPSPQLTPVSQAKQVSIGSLDKNTELCPGETYTIAWNAVGKISTASLNLIHTATPSSNMIIAIGIPSDYSEKAMMTRGKYTWTVGNLFSGEEELASDNGYVFAITVTDAFGDKYGVSEPFAVREASECQSYITPTTTPIITRVPTIFLIPTQAILPSITLTPSITP